MIELWNDRIVSPSVNEIPLQIKANWRFHRADCRDSQHDLMRNWGRRMAASYFAITFIALKSAREINC
jgi:hypothetical protein